jgi:hypothetical protein
LEKGKAYTQNAQTDTKWTTRVIVVEEQKSENPLCAFCASCGEFLSLKPFSVATSFLLSVFVLSPALAILFLSLLTFASIHSIILLIPRRTVAGILPSLHCISLCTHPSH